MRTSQIIIPFLGFYHIYQFGKILENDEEKEEDLLGRTRGERKRLNLIAGFTS